MFKRAQVGESMTWIVATVVILVVLFFGIFIAGGSGQAKKILGLDKTIEYSKSVDRVAEKSFYSFLQTGENFEKLKGSVNLDAGNGGPLAEEIFKGLYLRDYEEVWFGFVRPAAKNDYFGSSPSTGEMGGSITNVLEKGSVVHRIKFDSGESLELFLVKSKFQTLYKP